MAPIALLLAATVPLQVRFTTCPTWQVLKRDTIWAHDADTIPANPLSLSSYRGTLVAIAGHFADSDRPMPPSDFGGVVVSENGSLPRPIPRPDMRIPFESPVAVTDSRGLVHVVWGDTSHTTIPGQHPGAPSADSSTTLLKPNVVTPDSNARDSMPRAEPRIAPGDSRMVPPERENDVLRVWYATFDGRSWSTPRQLPGTEQLKWPHERSTPVVVDSQDRLHVVLASNDGPPRIVHFQLTQGGWRADTLSLSGLFAPHWATLIDRGDTVDIAYTLPVPEDRVPANAEGWQNVYAALHVTSLDLRTHTFSAPVVVYRSQERQAAHAHFLRSLEGTLTLVWEIRESSHAFFRELGAATRGGDGSWRSTGAPFVLPDDAEQVHSTAVDACGRLHLLLSLVPDVTDRRFHVVTLERDAWTSAVEIPIGMTTSGRARWASATDGTPRIAVGATPWTPQWTGGVPPTYWLLLTLR